MDWYSGPFSVSEGISSLQQRPRPGRGEIIIPRVNQAILRCPACGALQFALVQVTGPATKPTLDRPVRCGAGSCKACGILFTIIDGTAQKAAVPEAFASPLPISARLQAVLRPVPKLE